MIIYAGINPRALAFLCQRGRKMREKGLGNWERERKGVGVGLASRWTVRGMEYVGVVFECKEQTNRTRQDDDNNSEDEERREEEEKKKR